jgi:chemotaxis protein histidine kinase CheA
LLRNAVAHGIEAPAERASHAKPQLGTVAISLDALDSGEYELKVRDDGQGLLPERIREKLVHTGRYSAAQVAQWDDKQIIMQIFEPGFSTLDIANRDAGQGVGLDMVKDKITRLGARLRIASRPHQFTEFSIRFAVPA